MIRQLGKPTWFCSFSAAETRWPHLLRILGRIVEGKDYSDVEITEMTWQKKSELTQNDPVTCAHHFDHMVHLLINNFIKGEHKPIGDVPDFFLQGRISATRFCMHTCIILD